MTRPVVIPNIDDIEERYRSGESINRLARELTISCMALNRALRKRSVEIRDGGGAVLSSYATLPEIDKQRLLAARRQAAKTRTGRVCTPGQVAAMAHGRALSQRWIRPEERRFAEYLRSRGVDFAAQVVACDRYNLDFTVDSIAVEIERFDLATGPKQRRRVLHRLMEIRDAGWRILLVLHGEVIPLAEASAEYAITYAESARRNPATGGEYRVIWGDGKLLSAGDHDFDELARIWPGRGRQRLRPLND